MGAVVRVLMNLIQRQGLTRAVKTAQKLGFKNTEIKKAVTKLGSKRKPRKSFNQRKEAREYSHIMGNDPNLNRRMTPRFRDDDYISPKELRRMRQARKEASDHFDRYGQAVDPIY
tara:strand:+ start:81 stop:425 length:345 start_codon:yes stop_codon:yes gene_type:complete